MLPHLARGALAGLVVGLLVSGAPVWAADYNGPLIDAHSHLPNSTAIDAYAAAMKRHNVLKVVLLGAGGLQKDDTAWLTAASRKYPERVIAGLPLPDPTSESVVSQLELQLDRGNPRVIGEVHMRQVGRRLIDRDPNAAVFGKILDTAAKFAVPIVIHYELTDQAETALDRALRAHRKSTIVLAHGGEGPPGRLDRLLLRNPNLFIDLSGMHFQRTPALASETGPIDRGWKALIEKAPDRFMMGVDAGAARLFEPEMLDRLFIWTRRVLGELKPDVAARVAHGNAVKLYRLQ
jgi:predicted TIM-barrel fold metal-dependent hydrolase